MQMGKIMYFISFSFMTSAKYMLTELVNLAFESDLSREKVLAPVYPICTLVYSKYPNGVRLSTSWEKKSLRSLVSEK